MSKNRILIVEDEEAIAKMIAMNLKVANYETKIYYDGAKAAETSESSLLKNVLNANFGQP